MYILDKKNFLIHVLESNLTSSLYILYTINDILLIFFIILYYIKLNE